MLSIRKKKMKANQELLNHPFWEASDPARMRLVRVSKGFPPELNPFASDGVVIMAAGVPGEAPHSKSYVAWNGIRDGIEKGLIGPDTTVIEATSGNTGHGMAAVCGALGLRFVPVMSGDVPHDKINVIRVFGRRIGLHLVFDSDETAVEYARRLGAQDGWYNPDQYAGSWNVNAHFRYLAPQLWEQQKKISILAAPAGTMGTCLGLAKYARENKLGTTIVPVLCVEGEEVPGARSLTGVEKDIRHLWKKTFRNEDLQFGTRHEAFHLSFLTWSHVSQTLGPSFGLGFAGALRFLQKHKNAGTLEQFRDQKDGKIYVVVFGPDDYRPYTSLYLGELKRKELSAKIGPSDLIRLLD